MGGRSRGPAVAPGCGRFHGSAGAAGGEEGQAAMGRQTLIWGPCGERGHARPAGREAQPGLGRAVAVAVDVDAAAGQAGHFPPSGACTASRCGRAPAGADRGRLEARQGSCPA